MPIRAILYDLDGTLVDSFVAITASTNHVRELYGLPQLSEAVVREYVGFGLRHLLQALVPPADPDVAVQQYREHHPSVLRSGTRLFPGVIETLAALKARGVKQAICSNKQVVFTKRLVEELGLSPYLDEALGPEDVGVAKPDPSMVIEAMRRLKVSAFETLFIGDMAIDVQTARAAGVPVWIVLGGAAGKESAEGAGPDRVLKSIHEIVNLVEAVQ